MTLAPRIPSGTVTLLFSDVEGSTRLWEAEPEAMAPALRRHDELLRSAITSNGGYVFKTVGDAFCAAFSTASAALDSVLAAQRSLLAEPWPTSRPLRVRMALHTGVCEERDNDYFGPTVNRTARLEAVAHGGQVLVSGATAELLPEAPAGGVTLKDLGQHRLKDLGRPEQVFQVEAAFLSTGFPPLRSLDNPELSNNLPTLLSPFVGREAELEELRELMNGSRLVTLTGSGGAGKTRLALHAGAEALDVTGRGVFLVELAPVADPALLPAAVATAVGLKEHNGSALNDAVVAALGDQELLLVLDNCEHLIEASARFAEAVSRGCPRVRILATSREPLGVSGERVYRVPSLSLPPADSDSMEAVEGSDAVQLFVDRARAQDPAFVLDASVSGLVASVCRRLDGIPLALELAAARLSSMSLVHLHDRLDQRFRLLTGGSRNAMPRQQTLQAMVDWSFDLLNESEQAVLRRLSVFVGGFELEAAETVCATHGIDALDVADLLGSLVDKSLVVADRLSVSLRYRLLETIRQYAAQSLLKIDGEAGVLAARDRHAEYFLTLAEEAALELAGRRQGEWLRRLDLEWDNLRAAFAHWSEPPAEVAKVLRLGVALLRFFVSRGHGDILPTLRHAVGEAEGVPDHLLGGALLACSMLEELLRGQADPSARRYAGELCQRALDLARQTGDRPLEARALAGLSGFAYFERDGAEARRLGESAVAIAREIGDTHLLGEALRSLAIVADSPAERRRLRLETLACFRTTEDALFAAPEVYALSGVAFAENRVAEARAYLEEAIALAQGLGAELLLYFFQSDLCVVLLAEGETEAAAALVRSTLVSARRLGLRQEICGLIFAAACSAAAQGDLVRAARLHGAADVAIARALEMVTIRWTDAEEGLRSASQARLREALGSEAFQGEYDRGAALSVSGAVELALEPPEQ